MIKIIEEEHLKVKTAACQKEKPGYTICGDAYCMLETEGYFLAALADGLGSGEIANRSARLAVDVIEKEHGSLSLERLMSACNQSLISERGVVLTMLKIDYRTKRIDYVNVGNVECLINVDNETCYRPISMSGFLSGHRTVPRANAFHFHSELSFVLYSDGVEHHGMKDAFVRHGATPARFVKNRVTEQGVGHKDDMTIIAGHIT
ncbi:SpoIIE family protein phosphatase [Natribacillus halophilus]|uniref:Serine phosphatase n=1 Tax=Natribacillus halophilus TaxID=549003 RepID=A0A1G8QJX4_9BACI|nr:SpoIIE family protein phosphatase [Natribacillus halophilus]SDJ04946.1 serine phosphatase [Natribacillus halophilus]